MENIPDFENADHRCTSTGNTSSINNFHFRGTALGGWLVLEPWITPSLFYQFLGAYEKWGDEAHKHVGLDCLTFCTALGKEEANKQLRRHWKTWVTEKEIKNLKLSGADTLRIPVADWMYLPYEPFIGCWDGALDELDRVLKLCQKHDLKVMLDIHTMRYSQNGMDNSGHSSNIEWSVESTSTSSSGSNNGDIALPANLASAKVSRYRHWQIQSGGWIGDYNTQTKTYEKINMTNINHGLNVVRTVVQRYKNNTVVVGLEPVNEPWWETPIPWLKYFYWESYQIVQEEAPHWITLLHDSFRFYLQHWGTFMVDCPNYALDVHLYQAWSPPLTGASYQSYACEDGQRVREMEDAGVPVVVGEWSLATDSCAMWLGGFNDNGPGNPKVSCDKVRCPAPYMGSDQPNAPPDATKGPQDPFGSGGASYVDHGWCPLDKAFANEDEIIQALAYSKMHSYDKNSHGQFFWNFRTEFEPRWDFQEAVRRKWIPNNHEAASTIAAVALSCPAGTLRPQPLPRPGLGILSSSVFVFLYNHMVILGCLVAIIFLRYVKQKLPLLFPFRRRYTTLNNDTNDSTTNTTSQTTTSTMTTSLRRNKDGGAGRQMVGDMATQTSFLLDLAYQSTKEMESALEMKQTGKTTTTATTKTTKTTTTATTTTGLEAGKGKGMDPYDQMYSFFSSSTSSQRNEISPLHPTGTLVATAVAAAAASAASTPVRPSSIGGSRIPLPLSRTPPSSSSSSSSGGSVNSETDGSRTHTPDRDNNRKKSPQRSRKPAGQSSSTTSSSSSLLHKPSPGYGSSNHPSNPFPRWK